MATPINKTYIMPAGRSLYAGMNGPPTWAQNIQTRTWTEISGSSFVTGAGAIISPSSGYRGTNPIDPHLF